MLPVPGGWAARVEGGGLAGVGLPCGGGRVDLQLQRGAQRVQPLDQPGEQRCRLQRPLFDGERADPFEPGHEIVQFDQLAGGDGAGRGVQLRRGVVDELAEKRIEAHGAAAAWNSCRTVSWRALSQR